MSSLKAEWVAEDGGWMKRDLSKSRSIDWWTDGIHSGGRAEDDGALGFWAALAEVYPATRHRRCWVHKTAKVSNELPRSVQCKAKARLHEIWIAPTRDAAVSAFNAFLKTSGAKYPKATEKLVRDRSALLAFYDFPAEQWIHLRTTNPIDSTFATVRQRTSRTKNCVSRPTFLGLACKRVREAEKSWRRIRSPERLADLTKGTAFKDGIPVPDSPPEQQHIAA